MFCYIIELKSFLFYNIGMNLISYLKEIYGYDNPIFVKDIRIGGRSKTAIREELSRAYKKGLIDKKGNGIYFLRSNKEFGSGIRFDQILEKKFIYADKVPEDLKELYIEGYYSGMTFLNRIGLSDQVPAVYEITTNKTSSKKRFFVSSKNMAIIRKARTKINFQNYKYLQFLDMFHFISLEEVKENKQLICEYAKKIGFGKNTFINYIKLYGPKTMKKIVEGGILNELI